MAEHPKVLRFEENRIGRDFVIGDVHGAYDAVVRAMRAVGFKTGRDRLFCCGDLVDRGPESKRALAFLAQPYVHAVRGNHEDMFLDLHQNGDPHPAAIDFVCSRNGMGWWAELTPQERRPFLSAFERLPVAIEVETPRGTVGIVHAEVPAGLSWPEFTKALEAGDKKLEQAALWGRTRIGRGDADGVLGVGRVFHGHTPVEEPKRLGNVFHIDTGSVFGLLAEDPVAGRLTIAQLACATMCFEPAKAALGIVDARIDPNPPSAPFGAYAKKSGGRTER